MGFDRFRQVAGRVVRMDRAELSDRLRQGCGKWQDGILARMGYDFTRRVQPSGSTKIGRFFFGPEDIQERVELLRQRLPAQADGIIFRAERILRHNFDLLGYQDLSYGSPIDWHLDIVHDKRAPKKPFHRIRYLDFEEVGDSKITWELNRHQHFVTLAKAYRLTGDTRFADELLRQWRHWWAENPYVVGINWTSSLEAGFRSLSWLWAYNLLEGATGLPNFRDEWLRGLALHGRYIERYLSTYFSPNTHLLGEGVALFFLGVLCPELSEANRWKETGLRIVLEECRRQVRPDGFHFEQSTYYHVYALDFFLHASLLASVNDIPISIEFEQTLQSMMNVLFLLARAGGPPRFGDDDGGRLFDASRNRADYMRDPLAVGAILFNRPDFKAAAGQLREETIWLVGPQGVKVWDELDTASPPMESAALKSAGFYLLGAEKPLSQLTLDCGPLGTQSGGHGHADALSVTLQSGGYRLLIDPGTYAYVGDERNIFRSTSMHNTLKVDGVDQAEPGTAFSWRRLTQSQAENWVQGFGFDLIVASHDGYCRLTPPVVHRRWIFSLRNGIYLVRDLAIGEGRHHMELSWHLGPDLQIVEEGLFRVKGASNGLALLPAEGHGWAEEVRREAWSPVYGQKSAATCAVFSASSELPREFCTLLVTLEETLRKPGKFEQSREQKGDIAVRGYRFSEGAEEYQFFFSDDPKQWEHSGISSDAAFVCRHFSADREHLVLTNGSFAKSGQADLRFKKSVLWGELILEKARREIFSSEPDAVSDEPGPSYSTNRDASDLS